MKRLIFALLILAGCTVPVETVTSTRAVIGNSDGGFFQPVAGRIAQMQATGQRAVLAQDYCWSACTLYLAVAECVGARTLFGFHGATQAVFIPDPDLTKIVAEYYPGNLKHWFLTTSASDFDPFGIKPMRGAEVSKLTGIPLCASSQ